MLTRAHHLTVLTIKKSRQKKTRATRSAPSNQRACDVASTWSRSTLAGIRSIFRHFAERHSENGRPGPRGHTARVAVATAAALAVRACAPTDSATLRNVSAVCGSVCSSATSHAPPVRARRHHVRHAPNGSDTPSWRHGWRHSHTTCVQGCARTPRLPARCCPDALTPPVRANGRLPRALAPLHRPSSCTESFFFLVVIFSTRGRIAPQPPRRRAEFEFGCGARRGGAGGAHRNAPARTPNSPDGRAPRTGICHVSVRRIHNK